MLPVLLFVTIVPGKSPVKLKVPSPPTVLLVMTTIAFFVFVISHRTAAPGPGTNVVVTGAAGAAPAGSTVHNSEPATQDEPGSFSATVYDWPATKPDLT